MARGRRQRGNGPTRPVGIRLTQEEYAALERLRTSQPYPPTMSSMCRDIVIAVIRKCHDARVSG